MRRQSFELPHHVIAQVADCATAESWQTRNVHGPVLRHDGTQTFKDIRRHGHCTTVRSLENRQLAFIALNDDRRTTAQK